MILRNLKKIKQSRSKLADEYFRNNAADWEILRKLHIDNDKIDAALLNNITIGKIGSLLDIGTGTGHILKILSPKVNKAIGIDKSHEMLSIARANIDKAQYPNIELRHGDMYNIAYNNNYFDIITIHMGVALCRISRSAFKRGKPVIKAKWQSYFGGF